MSVLYELIMMRDSPSLDQILQNALRNQSRQYYALAISKSRIQQPTSQSVQLVLELISVYGDMWIQVLQKMALRRYDLCFYPCLKYQNTFPLLLVTNDPKIYRQQFEILQKTVIQALKNNVTSQLYWRSLQQLLSIYSRQCQGTNIIQFVDMLNILLTQGGNLNQAFNQFLETQIKEFSTQVSNTSVTAFKIYCLIIKILTIRGHIALKNNNYLSFQNSYQATFLWIQNICLKLIEFANLSLNLQMHQNRFRIKLQNLFYQDMLKCLWNLADFPIMNGFLFQLSSPLLKMLLTTRLDIQKFTRSKQNDIEDKLHFQYGLIMGDYGDDLPSIFTKTVVKLIKQIPGLLKQYVCNLFNQQYKYQISLQQKLIKLAIIHKQFIERSDLNQEIRKIFSQIQNQLHNQGYSIENSCRKLRLNSLFMPCLTAQHFKQLLQTCFKLLRTSKEASYQFKQAQNILQNLIQDSNKLDNRQNRTKTSIFIKQHVQYIIKSIIQIVSEINLQNLFDKQEKIYKLLKLLYTSIQKNQLQAEYMSPQIIYSACTSYMQQIKFAWHKGIKNTPVIDKWVRLIIKCIEIAKQDFYFNILGKLYQVLELFKQPQNIQHHDQLIKIMIYILETQKQVKPDMIPILISMQNLVQCNKGNIFCIKNILEVLCKQIIANSVLQSWPLLVDQLVRLFLNYFQNFVDQQYCALYKQQWLTICYIFGGFLQSYESFLLEQPVIRSSILHTVNSFPESQIRLQLFLILNHQELLKDFSFFHLNMMNMLKQRTTMHLLCLYYIDNLLKNFEENFLYEFIQFIKRYKQKKNNRELSQNFQLKGPYFDISTSFYVNQGLQSLKKQRKIDKFYYNQLIRQIDFRY